jgi:hypothetical protein
MEKNACTWGDFRVIHHVLIIPANYPPGVLLSHMLPIRCPKFNILNIFVKYNQKQIRPHQSR